jgi:hypothetical protein
LPDGAVALVLGCIRLRRGQQFAKRRSPLLGEHTEEILREVLGFDAAKAAEYVVLLHSLELVRVPSSRG